MTVDSEQRAAKSRPILFSAPMVRANLEGLKTQTRRVVKPQPRPGPVPGMVACYEGDWVWRRSHHSFTISSKPNGPDDIAEDCPYGVPGDELFVKESHYLFGHWEKCEGLKPRKRSTRQRWKFVPDSDEVLFDAPPSFRKGRHKEDPETHAWHRRSSLHLAKKHSRLTLRVLSVRVERLQDISEADAKAEGVAWTSGGSLAVPLFEALWKKINGPGSWDANPWVWVVGYERVKAGV